jgi:hypothetical protein
LDAAIVGNDLGNPGGHEQERTAVVAPLHQRYSFALKASYLSVRQNRFQAVTHLYPGAPIAYDVQNQNPAIRRLAADSPFFEQVDGVGFYVGAIERIDRNDGNLRMGLLVDLPTDAIHLPEDSRIKNMREIIDIILWSKLRDRLCLKKEGRQ